jgi:hypothetical protein
VSQDVCKNGTVSRLFLPQLHPTQDDGQHSGVIGLLEWELTPSGFISKNELDAAKSVHFDYLNTQGQQKMVWPPSLSLSRAYLDQLERSKGLEAGKIADARRALDRAEKASGPEQREALTRLAAQLDGEVNAAKDAIKVRTLAGVIRELSTEPSLARGQ